MREAAFRMKWFAAAVSVCAYAASAAVSMAQDGPPGITKPVTFAPFNAAAPTCTVPPGLEKVLGFAQDDERQFMQVSREASPSPRRIAGSHIASCSPKTIHAR